MRYISKIFIQMHIIIYLKMQSVYWVIHHQGLLRHHPWEFIQLTLATGKKVAFEGTV